MKNFIINLLSLVLVSSSNQQCSKHTTSNNSCQQIATFRYNMCGVGLWGPMVLELETGEIVQPWYSDNPQIANFQPRKDQQVRVTLTTIAPDARYAHVVTCMAIGQYQERISRYVRVDCLESMPE